MSKHDLGLIRALLTLLRALGDGGLCEDRIAMELDIAAGRCVTTFQAQDTYLFCKDKGWIESRTDDFGRVLVFITEAGKNRLAGM